MIKTNTPAEGALCSSCSEQPLNSIASDRTNLANLSDGVFALGNLGTELSMMERVLCSLREAKPQNISGNFESFDIPHEMRSRHETNLVSYEIIVSLSPTLACVVSCDVPAICKYKKDERIGGINPDPHNYHLTLDRENASYSLCVLEKQKMEPERFALGWPPPMPLPKYAFENERVLLKHTIQDGGSLFTQLLERRNEFENQERQLFRDQIQSILVNPDSIANPPEAAEWDVMHDQKSLKANRYDTYKTRVDGMDISLYAIHSDSTSGISEYTADFDKVHPLPMGISNSSLFRKISFRWSSEDSPLIEPETALRSLSVGAIPRMVGAIEASRNFTKQHSV